MRLYTITVDSCNAHDVPCWTVNVADARDGAPFGREHFAAEHAAEMRAEKLRANAREIERHVWGGSTVNFLDAQI